MFDDSIEDQIIQLVPTGNGYYVPRYPSKVTTTSEESPGVSIAERDSSTAESISKLRTLKHITKIDW